jgi:hypothetical protein
MDVTLSEEQRVEVHEGLMLRVEQTKKAKKTNEEAGLRAGVREAEARLRLLRGQDGEPGLLSMFVDQTTLDFNGGQSEPSESDLFDGTKTDETAAAGSETANGEKPKGRRGRTKARVAVDAVNEADHAAGSEPEYEIVDDTPPPRAEDVTSLVPHE